MATINFAFFFFFLTLSALLQTHHARHLNDGYIYVRFGQRPPFTAAPEVIQMVTGDQGELQSPPFSSRDNPKAPPSPKVAPSRGEATYGRVKPKAPPSPKVAPSGGQKTYGGDNPNVAPPSWEVAEHYGRNQTEAPPSPEVAPSRGETTYGGDNPKTPPLPEVAPSRGQTTYGVDKANSNCLTPYNRVDPRTPPTPDRSDPRIQNVDGRVDPTEPTRPLLGGSICVEGGSACSGLLTTTVDGRKILSPPQAPAIISDAQIKSE